MAGIQDQKFEHYSLEAGENKGQSPTSFSSSELDRALNVENRGRGLATRYGSQVLTADAITGYPSPIATNPNINAIDGFQYNSATYDTLFSAGTALYRDSTTPVSLKTGLTNDLKFQFESAGDLKYASNGTDAVLFYDPSRSTATAYTAGYDTPAAFTATPSALGGAMATGDYSYFAVLYDSNTETRSNRQVTAVTATVVGPTGSVALTLLPIDPEDRSTDWIIYRLDPSGYYYYELDRVTYNAGAPNYTDTAAATGTSSIVENDNDKPDPASTLCRHDKLMVYASGNVLTWSKNYRFQNVPTYNRELLDDNSQGISKVLSFRETVVIFKTDSIYTAVGDLNGNYTINCISKILGTRSPETVKESPDGIFFLDSAGKPRFLNSTDFAAKDLRDSTDISFKYRRKFELLDRSQLSNCFAVLWRTSAVTQYRLFVPVDVSDGTCDHCYIYDYSLAQRNGGDSAWFDFGYMHKLKCAAVVTGQDSTLQLQAGDDFGLIWQLDVQDVFYDSVEFFRAEGADTLVFGVSTIDIPSFTMGVDECVGATAVLYDQYTYNELFRSKVTTNTTTQITLQDVLPTLSTEDVAISIGGYLTYFATCNFSVDHAGRCRAFKMSMLFDEDYAATELQAFTHYDFNQQFNYTYDYINDPVNTSATPLADNYSLVIGGSNSFYDDAIYGDATYSNVSFETQPFLLNSKYLFNHVSWGVITREPSQPFGYLGATFFFQGKELTL